MNIERIIIGISWIATVCALWKWIPRDSYSLRKAHVSFLFKQVITWLFGLLVVEWGLIYYPIHDFEHASQTSFTFEYFVYPSLCALYNIHFPVNKRFTYKCLYTAYYTTFITIIEVLLEHYTFLIKYINWSWYWTWITLFIAFYISSIYVTWFFNGFKLKNKLENE